MTYQEKEASVRITVGIPRAAYYEFLDAHQMPRENNAATILRMLKVADDVLRSQNATQGVVA